MQLDRELKKLDLLLLKMADTVQDNIIKAFSTFKNDSNLENIEINDDIIDDYEKEIEEACLNLILKERLYASDLRKVSGILKMIDDLERIGDHAFDIIEYNQKIKGYKKIKIEEIEDMLATALSMVKDSILSFIKGDLALANDVIERDELIDTSFNNLIDFLVEETNKCKMAASYSINTTMILKYIERIADHAVNISEWVIYIGSGIYKDKRIF